MQHVDKFYSIHIHRYMISGIHILWLLLLILFILDYQAFYLFPYPSWMEFLKNNQLNLTIGFGGIILTLLLYQFNAKYNPQLYAKILKYDIICLLVWIGLVLYSSILYPRQPLRLTVGFHATFLYVFLIIPSLTLLYKKRDPDIIFRMMNIVAFIWYLVLIYQQITYASTRTLVFNIQELTSSTSRELVRYFGIRLSLKSVGGIMILYNFDFIINKKKGKAGKYFSLISFILGMYCLIFIAQTRVLSVVVSLGLAAILLSGARKANRKVVVISIVIIILSLLYYYGVFENLLFSISTNIANKERGGTMIRFDALSYYWKCFLKSPLFGNGFTSDYYYPSVQHGPSGKSFYSDIGIFGLIGEVGLCSIPLYFYPLFRVCKAAHLLLKRKVVYKCPLLIGLTVYLITSSATLLITATNLMIAFPIIIAYAEYINSELKV